MTEREELRKRLEYQLDARTFNTQLHEDLIAFLARAQPQEEPVGYRARRPESGAAWILVPYIAALPTELQRFAEPVYASPPAQAVPEGWVPVEVAAHVCDVLAELR